MVNMQLMGSSVFHDWETPQDLFDSLQEEYNFTLDVCATKENAKCTKFFTKEQDGLIQNWENNICFMNPPYGRQLNKWVIKAFNETKKPNTKVIALLPSRTDTKIFHDYITYGDVYFLRGRLKFKHPTKGIMCNAPFGSILVEWPMRGH